MHSITETARLLGISKSFVRKLITQGQIEVTRIGKCIRIPQASIDALIAKGSAKPRLSGRRAKNEI